ncbi:hypothetical protein [Streptomyces noursei]|uniref:hypothetical protein n=1 Tax=Streptomyces noursei TaxID=1971 RepID=UPI00167C155B|nr:hypothetical protein [Streptomyces noursei]MCZ1012706.1 hypothetical protein [Streptomyces noursei]MCZ1021064.1 hypothetical protein [Streptomyces noursei]GGX57674.1 hypothetical protein GCM10010341_91930 [Streptomyces noursei]
MMASASYRPLVAVLQGLRARDERIVERMIVASRGARGKATSVVALDPQREEEEEQQAAGEGGQEPAAVEDLGAGTPEEGEGGQERGAGRGEAGREQDEDQEDEKKGVPLLRFSLPRNPDVIAAFLRTRVLRPDSQVWLAGYNALRKWVESTATRRCRWTRWSRSG